MSFKFTARALLELGRELISSDEVALYELIKNSVDAGSTSIRITYRVVLPHSKYAEIAEAIETHGLDREKIVYHLRAALDPNASAEIIEEFFAFLEARAIPRGAELEALREAYQKFNWIEISDEGHGMSLDELDKVFLTVGTRSRRAANVDGATYLGDKGVGRLSAMRLGEQLSVTTTRAGEKFLNLLKIDWSMFSHDTDTDVADIEIKPQLGDRKPANEAHGTTIRISNLAGDWSLARLQDMLAGQIARMIDPFERGFANRLIAVRYNGIRLLIPSIPGSLMEAAHASCTASFRIDDGEPVLTGNLVYRLRRAEWPVIQRGAEILSFSQKVYSRPGKAGHAATVISPLSLKALVALGSFDVEIYWYNRLVIEAIKGLTNKVRESREEVAKWSGGPMLYRRGYRILPYGDPGNDWLELDKKAFGSGGFKLNRQQIIGRVKITASHETLSEQTNREGLIESDAFHALKTIMMWLTNTEFRGFINRVDEAYEYRSIPKGVDGIDLAVTGKNLDDAFAAIGQRAGPQASDSVERLRALVEELRAACQKALDAYSAETKKAEDEREKFLHLAGIGLITEFIFHELDRSIQHTLGLLGSRSRNTQDALANLEAQLKTLQKRVSAFESTTGAKRQSKGPIDVAEIIEQVLANHENEFSRHGISADFRHQGRLEIKGVKGMLIQILENLVANSIYWLKRQKDMDPKFVPNIEIMLDANAKELIVSDNGIGVDPSRREVIFEPFVSSKPANQGRGLGLYISRELADYHDWTLETGDEVGRLRKGRINDFILRFHPQIPLA